MGYSKSLNRIKKVEKTTTILDIIALIFISFFSFFKPSNFEGTKFNLISSTQAYLFKHKVAILAISLVIVVLKKGYHKFIVIREQPFQFRNAILEEMLNRLFNNNRNIRITIFKEVGFMKDIYFHLKTFIRYCYKRFRDRPTTKPYWGKHIQVYQRAGWEIKKSKTTFFYSPNTRHHCQGIAARVIQNYETIQETNLPNINNINLDKIDINDTKNPDVKRVKEYMRRSYISNFRTLKDLNARAIHFNADVIFGGKGSPTGVLIIDCLEGANPFNDNNMEKLPHYLKLIASTFGGNIYE